jgi:D-tyrosyl-tRNA(Tyr) deacylase
VGTDLIGEIDRGLLVLVGIHQSDRSDQARWAAGKVAGLRIFADANGKMNLDVREAGGKILAVSQFTLYGNCAKGNRPSFMEAARPEHARSMYEEFVTELRSFGVSVACGRFGADMKVELINDGPVTLILDSLALTLPTDGFYGDSCGST